eukprot:TRINITY_DN7974_c0_g2_i1.p1 TRINITY_DN7974_c0_g2~~TRINITY_DN7974_c0_g2_i1.p1  ORF type:complete len:445 (+),score=83.23 TRINITY_DN7974_c0_g2_i1:178-1512(+)
MCIRDRYQRRVHGIYMKFQEKENESDFVNFFEGSKSDTNEDSLELKEGASTNTSQREYFLEQNEESILGILKEIEPNQGSVKNGLEKCFSEALKEEKTESRGENSVVKGAIQHRKNHNLGFTRLFGGVIETFPELDMKPFFEEFPTLKANVILDIRNYILATQHSHFELIIRNYCFLAAEIKYTKSHLLVKKFLTKAKISGQFELPEHNKIITMYKTQPCPTNCGKHDCIYYHNNHERRRVPAVLSKKIWDYVPSMCVYAEDCGYGKGCWNCHNEFERNYHPLRFKREMCPYHDPSGQTLVCPKYGKFCCLAHSSNDLRDIKALCKKLFFEGKMYPYSQSSKSPTSKISSSKKEKSDKKSVKKEKKTDANLVTYLLEPLIETKREPFTKIMTAVSYTHLTLPTILLVQISVVAVSLKKKTKQIKRKEREKTSKKKRKKQRQARQ